MDTEQNNTFDTEISQNNNTPAAVPSEASGRVSSDTLAVTGAQMSSANGEAADSYRFWAESGASDNPAAPEQDFSSSQGYYYAPNYNTPPENAVPKKKHHFFRSFFTCVATAACFGIVAGVSFFGVRFAYNKLFPEAAAENPLVLPGNAILSGDTEKTPSTNLPSLTIPTVSLVEPGETDGTDIVAQIVNQTMPAMVSINATTRQTVYYFGRPYVDEIPSSGSGIIVGSNDTELLIATNYHVVEDASALNVVLADGTKHDVTVKGTDPAADLAIVALPFSGLTKDTLEQIDIAVLGDSDNAQVGQMVIAIGNALGYGRSVTVGYLSAKDREVKLNGTSMTLLQTNAAINPGNSGGALLNTKGEVIGINNAKISSTDIEGICFAIPISKATPILKDLMTREILSDEEKGYLGINLRDLDSSIFSLYNWPEGVYIDEVRSGSPAEAAGIYRGDIITHINDTKVTTVNQLQNIVFSHRAGTEVTVTLQRITNGAFQEYTFRVTLADKASLNLN